MTYDTVNDAQTIAGSGEGTSLTENGTPMDKSIGDGPTMRPKEERGGRGAFALGDMIAGRYVVEKVLGEGGMGIVYQCLDKVGSVSVAVKCLPPEVSRNADEMEDIRANYRLVSDLHHPNIACARTLEVNVSTGDYYLVMDLARGTSLKRWMRRNPQATMATKLAILRQVAVALDYAHARKVIHRDMKPENVMVDDEGVVKVLDFGLAAQIRSSQSRTSAAVTSRGGTPGYKSPEQWRGKPQRESADVYSFGVMAYWMFAGALPFDGDDPVVLGHAVLTESVEPIMGLPAHMNAALVKALAKEPEQRFVSCGAFMDALEGKGDFSHKEHKEPVELRSRAVVKGLLAAALLAALAGGGYYGLTKYGEGVKAREAQQTEERARHEKAVEERIAKLKAEAEKRRIEAEKEKAEAEKRRIAAERGKRQKEEAKRKIAAELEKDRKIRDLSAVEDEIEDCKGRINGILKGNVRAHGSLKGDWQGFDASKITIIDATTSVKEEMPWKRITKDITGEDSVVTIENAIVTAQEELKRLKERLENIRRIKGIYDAKELESRKEQCRSCGGSKRVACIRCKGEGRVRVTGDDCSACDGKGVISKPRPCDACGGSGNSSVKRRCSYCQGRKLRCSSCRGRGFFDITGSLRRTRCDACNGRGYYSCDSCGGRGTEVETVSCKKCSGSGTLDVTMHCSRCAGVGKEQREQACPSCDGTGKSTCESCGGRGFIYRQKSEVKSQLREKEGIRTSSQLQSGGDDLDTPLSALAGVTPSSVEPYATIVATLNGSKVDGAKLNDGKNDYVLPVTWNLRSGLKYGPYKVSCEIGGRRYYGMFDAITVDWRGSKVISVALSASDAKPQTTSVVLKTGPKGVQLWEGGPYWADRNIGAEKPEGYGYYFWWGDTVGYKREGGSWVASDRSAMDFSWANAPTDKKDLATLRSEGWITSANALVPAHDAANVHWGGTWRMPTERELQDLGDKCDWNWTTVNGVRGYVVRGRGNYASQSIFLPCAGYGFGTLLYNAGLDGYYWSSVPDSDGSNCSWSLNFYSSGRGTNDYLRDYGRSVRPVQGFAK